MEKIHSRNSGTGREWKKSIPEIREREGNEKNPFPKFGNGKGMKKIYSRNSFLGQLFLQQQEMMAEQQQQRKEQVQMQQQMLQLMTHLGGALEGRMSPLLDMGAMQGRQTASFRPVGL